jgi:hypothetical protein
VIRAVDIALGAGVVVVGLVPREGGGADPLRGRGEERERPPGDGRPRSEKDSDLEGNERAE